MLVHLAQSVLGRLMTREEALDRARSHPSFFPEPEETERTLACIEQLRHTGDTGLACLVAWLYIELLDGKQLRLGPVWLPAAVAFVNCAAEHLVAAPDAALFARAERTAGEMLAPLRETGGGDVPGALREQDLLLCAARLYARPFGGELRAHDLRHAHEIWLDRARNDVWFDPRLIDEYEIPDIEDALSIARSLLAEAERYTEGPDLGRVLADRARIERALADLRGQKTPRSVKKLFRRALELLHADGNQAELLNIAVFLASNDERPDIPPRVYAAPSLEGVLATYGPAGALRFLAIGARVCSLLDSPGVHDWLAEADRLPVDFGTETDRAYLWAIAGHHLPGDVLGCPPMPLRLDAAVRAVERRELDAPQTAAAYAHLAYHASEQGPYHLVARAFTLDPAIMDRPAFRYLWLAVAGARAQCALRDSDPEAAARDTMAALELAASLALTEKVGTLLRLLTTAAGRGGGAATTAADAMVKIGPGLLAALGETSLPDLLELYGTLGACLTEDPARLLTVHQLAKGHEFDRLISDPGPVPERPDEVALIEQLDAAERAAGADAIDHVARAGVDNELVVISYAGAAELTSGREPSLAAANAQRAYDRSLRDHAVCSRGAAPTPLTLPEIQHALGPTRVLIDLHLGGVSSDGLMVVLVSNETAEVFELGIGGGDTPVVPNLTLLLDDLTVQLHSLGVMVADTRREIQSEPPLRRPVTRAGEHRLAQLHGLFTGEIGARLDALRDSGRDHLCLWAHGPLHQLPFHLLRTASEAVPDRWTVTALPGLRLIKPAAPPDGPWAPLLSIGCAAGGTAFDLPEEKTVEAQATDIATIFGATPLLGGAATPDAVLAAMPGARWIHLAAHGALNVAAPALQCVYLAGGRLFAHQVLRLDLRAVDLVTLSTCESALGRHDTADNLRGLAESLFAAGVRTVVGCLWPVHPNPATVFFTAFYRGLAAGQPKVDAFGRARTHVRAACPEYRDWGAFTYLGGW